ncbi:hypothetical protein [Candidatus Ichthyocystis sparus]|uniref:hypothetical protein n=1 Tax=Candidatus Ichthyocystis sparus TaxID=1561004 RepID=UPI000B818B37|nr:hypothetical protein [Candidatus Ichthyocystis sparus]
MFYNDSKCLDYSTRRNFECQSNDEVETESDCTTVVFTEHKKNSRSEGSYYSFNGSLSSSCMGASLAIISTLEGVNGENVSSKLCGIGKDLCEAIVAIPGDVDQSFIRSAFEDGASRLRRQGKENAFNFSFPLLLPRAAGDNDPTGSDLLTQLSGIEEYINKYLNTYETNGLYFDLTGPFYSTKFCDNDHNPNVNSFVRFCDSIRNYIDYPFTQSATERSDYLKTTVSNFMSSVVTESTTKASEIIRSTDVLPSVASSVISSTASESIISEYQPSSGSLSSYLCYLEASLCRLIMINNDGNIDIEEILESAFGESVALLGGESAFEFSRPLTLSSNVSDGHNVVKQLWSMSNSVHGEFTDHWRKLQESGVNPYRSNSACVSAGSKFCSSTYSLNLTVINECCDNLFSYLDYRNISPRSDVVSEVITSTTVLPAATTLVPEVLNLTDTVTSGVVASTAMAEEVLNSTTIESEVTTIGLTSLIPTKITPASTNINTSNIVLISFLFIAFAILAFLGYRSCKNNKSRQPISQNDNINAEEELEDLV